MLGGSIIPLQGERGLFISPFRAVPRRLLALCLGSLIRRDGGDGPALRTASGGAAVALGPRTYSEGPASAENPSRVAKPRRVG